VNIKPNAVYFIAIYRNSDLQNYRDVFRYVQKYI